MFSTRKFKWVPFAAELALLNWSVGKVHASRPLFFTLSAAKRAIERPFFIMDLKTDLNRLILLSQINFSKKNFPGRRKTHIVVVHIVMEVADKFQLVRCIGRGSDHYEGSKIELYSNFW